MARALRLARILGIGLRFGLHEFFPGLSGNVFLRVLSGHRNEPRAQRLREALEAFFEIREVPGIKKKPSTSELLDWLKLLMAEDIPPEALASKDQHKIIPPLHGALLKNEQDVHLFERLVFMSRRK